MATEKTTKRGRWKEGESGNPNGRKPGTGAVAKLRDSIAAHLPEIILQLVSKAKQGDAQAARLLLERVLPPMKAIEQPVTLSLPAGEGISGKVSIELDSFTRMVSAMVSPQSAILNIQPEWKNWLSRMVSTAMVRGKVRTGTPEFVRNTACTKRCLISLQFRNEGERQNLYASMD